MKMFVISDNSDTCIGLRMAGADGVVVHTEQELNAALDRVLARDDIAVLLINGALASLSQARIDDIKMNLSTPMLVEIPDRHGNGRDENAISQYIRSAIGIKI